MIQVWASGATVRSFSLFFLNSVGKFNMVAFAKKRPWFRLGLGFNLSPFHFHSYIHDWKNWIFELHNRSNHLTTKVLSSKHWFYNFNFIFMTFNLSKFFEKGESTKSQKYYYTYHIKNLRQSDAHIDCHIFGMIKNWTNMSIIIRQQIFQKSWFMLSSDVSLW